MNHSSAQRQRQQLARKDWEQAALQMLAERGVEGLAIEPLARRLGVTKGSFYWHFSDRMELLKSALATWENVDAHNLAVLLTNDLPARDKLIQFFHASSRPHLTHQVYSALLAAPQRSGKDEWLNDVLKRVDGHRIRQLSRAYAELDSERAEFQSRLAYYTYVGFLQLQARGLAPQPDTPEYEHYLEHLIATLIPLCQ